MTPGPSEAVHSENSHLPVGWRWVALGELCHFIRGVSFDKADVRLSQHASYLPILRAGNIRDELDLRTDLIWVSQERVVPEQLLRVHDIVICMSSGSASVVGKTARLKEPWVGSVGAFCGIIRPREATMAAWLDCWLGSPGFVAWRDLQARGASIQNLRFSEFDGLEVPLPPSGELGRMSAILTEQLAVAERARAAAEAQLEAAEGLPSAYLREVFCGAEARRWPCVPLGAAGEIVSGITLGRKLSEEKVRPIAYLRVANVKDAYLDLSSVYTIEATDTEIERLRLRDGDLLLTEGGDPDKLGRGACWRGEIAECIHQNHIFRVRFDPKQVLPGFVSAQVASQYGKAYFLANAKQTTGIATINQRVLAAFPLMVPGLEEQGRVMTALGDSTERAGRARQQTEEQMVAINSLAASLLRRAFSGDL